MLYNDAPSSAAQTTQKDEHNVVTRPPLQDRFGRTFNYIRIAVTEKCNLRCTYCMPEEGVNFKHGDQILSAADIHRVVGILATMGIRKVRFTGGEPTVRKDIATLIKGTVDTPGIRSINLTTNGILFDKYAEDLLAAGLTGINFSLDTMEKEKFVRITRRSGGDKVLENIKLALSMGFPSVKVNNVLMAGFNDDEIFDFTELTKDYAVTVRFIEFMPFDAHQIWETGEHFFSAEQIVGTIKKNYPGIEPAPGSRTEHHIFKVPGYKGKIAVIPAFTRSLCGNCSRIRLTADGNIRNCLYSEQEYPIRDLLREGANDEAIVAAFRKAYAEKAIDGFAAKKISMVKRVNAGDIGRVSMTQIGG